MNAIKNYFAIYLPKSISWVSGHLGRLIVSDRLQTSSPWSRPLADSGPHPIPSAILAVIVIIWSIASWLVSALAKVVSLAKPLFSVIYLRALLVLLINCPWLVGWLISIDWFFQYCFIASIDSSICEQSKIKSILFINCALASNYPL